MTRAAAELALLDMRRTWRRLDPGRRVAVLDYHSAGRQFPALVQAVEAVA